MRRMYSENQLEGIIKQEVESGKLLNAKPIYCHPIYCSFLRDADTLVTFTCLIFNNNSTPFTKDTFFQWCLDLFDNYPTASVMASGYVNNKPASRIKTHPSTPESAISLETINADATDNDYWTISLIPDSATFTDGVNKIN